MFEAVTYLVPPKSETFPTTAVEQLTISLRHTSKCPCNHRLRRIFPASPIIIRIFRIRLQRAYTNLSRILSIRLRNRDLAAVLTSNRKDQLPEWKFSENDGNLLEWHEWIGQFQCAVDSQSTLLDDVAQNFGNWES